MGYEANKKWRLRNPEKRDAGKSKNYNKSRQFATNSRRPWAPEDVALLSSFDGTDIELSKKIGRSVQAIQVKRSNLTAP